MEKVFRFIPTELLTGVEILEESGADCRPHPVRQNIELNTAMIILFLIVTLKLQVSADVVAQIFRRRILLDSVGFLCIVLAPEQHGKEHGQIEHRPEGAPDQS
jgi:hypothetical protein